MIYEENLKKELEFLKRENQSLLKRNTNLYLMAVDCQNRLFSKFQANAEIKQVKNWEEPTNNKLMKKTILNSCSY